MTKQEAIDELHKHYVPEYVNYLVTALTDGATPSDAPTINAIPIPEDATNGDVIKAMFPNGKIIKTEDGDCGYEIYLDDTYSFCSWFDGLWWNAPYKGVR